MVQVLNLFFSKQKLKSIFPIDWGALLLDGSQLATLASD